MTDWFALFGQPRRPWLDPDELKQTFLSLSAEVHPDRVHNASLSEKQTAQQRYTELNAAYKCLREPKDRLHHLLQLERGAKPSEIQEIPSALMEFFFEVSQLCRSADSFLEQKLLVTSPMLKVGLFEQGQEWTEKLVALQQNIAAAQQQLLAELKTQDAAWLTLGASTSSRTKILDRLEDLYRLLGYFNRWHNQIQERILQLSIP